MLYCKWQVLLNKVMGTYKLWEPNQQYCIIGLFWPLFPSLYFGQREQISKQQHIGGTGGTGVRGRAGGRAQATLAWVGNAYTWRRSPATKGRWNQRASPRTSGKALLQNGLERWEKITGSSFAKSQGPWESKDRGRALLGCDKGQSWGQFGECAPLHCQTWAFNEGAVAPQPYR